MDNDVASQFSTPYTTITTPFFADTSTIHTTHKDHLDFHHLAVHSHRLDTNHCQPTERSPPLSSQSIGPGASLLPDKDDQYASATPECTSPQLSSSESDNDAFASLTPAQLKQVNKQIARRLKQPEDGEKRA